VRGGLLLGCTALLLASAPAQAFFSDDEARKQIVEVKKTLESLGQRIDSAAQNRFDFANQIETLRADVARLRGQVEELGYSLESAHKRQQDFYVDLDNRLRKLESVAAQTDAAIATEAGITTGTAAGTAAGTAGTAGSGAVATTNAPPSATAAAPAPADPQAEMRDYEAALGLFRDSKFKETQTALEAFITRHPQSALLPSVHYWLGSSLYQQKGFLQAATAYGKVASRWPNDGKAPEALLQQANALVGAKDVPAAIKVLETLVEKYPTSPAVETARARLKTLAPKKKR
jgi:tol-pal system protein YbgF